MSLFNRFAGIDDTEEMKKEILKTPTQGMQAMGFEESLLAGATPALLGIISGSPEAASAGLNAGASILGQNEKLKMQNAKSESDALAKLKANILKQKLGGDTNSASSTYAASKTITVPDGKGGVKYMKYDPSSSNYVETGLEAVVPSQNVKQKKMVAEGLQEVKEPIVQRKENLKFLENVNTDKLAMGFQQSSNAADNVINALAQGKGVADQSIRFQVPKMLGEVGNLNQSEQNAVTGDPRLSQQAKRAIEIYFATGTLPETDAKDLIQLATVFKEVQRRKFEQRVNFLSDTYQIASERQLPENLRGRLLQRDRTSDPSSIIQNAKEEAKSYIDTRQREKGIESKAISTYKVTLPDGTVLNGVDDPKDVLEARNAGYKVEKE